MSLAPAPGMTGFGDLAVADSLSTRTFAQIAEIMDREARIALPPTKTTLVCSRLSRRLRERGLTTFEEYIRLVDEDPEERAAMVTALTTNHTHFFREDHHFDHFRSDVLPALRNRAQSGQPVRIWSAGCSSGEEIYSLLMCMFGTSKSEARWVFSNDVKVLATDLSPRVVAMAKAGVYSEMTVRPIPTEYRQQWLRPEGSDYAIVDEMRNLLVARELNLFGAWPMRQQYDVIFCRNVMIYFEDDAKAELLQRFVQLLRPGGHIYIGHSERLVGPATKALVSCGQTIYRKDTHQ